jgi:PKD repeat protein
MNRQLAATACALIGFLVSRAAAALTLTLAPLPPSTIGQAQTFKIATVQDAVGPVMFRWNFGDGALSDLTADTQVTHTYAAPGHYTIIVQGSDDAARTSAVAVETATYPLPARACGWEPP